MKDLFPVKVECYSGYKTNEYPRRFYFNSIRYDVAEVLDRWYQLPAPPPGEDGSLFFPAVNYFKVRTSDGKIYILKHEIKADQWYLWIKGESVNLQ